MYVTNKTIVMSMTIRYLQGQSLSTLPLPILTLLTLTFFQKCHRQKIFLKTQHFLF